MKSMETVTHRIKRYVSAAALAVSVVVGGGVIASNTHMIAFTADAGLPAPLPTPTPTPTPPPTNPPMSAFECFLPGAFCPATTEEN